MLTVNGPSLVRSTARLTPRAVVIGSGFGGLAAAIRLGARGYRVTVLEKLGAAGGRGAPIRQDGFIFDAGPTIITAPFLFEELWTLMGRRMADDIDLRRVSPFYDIRFPDGSVFRESEDLEAMRAEVAKFSPGDVEGFDAFVNYSLEAYRAGFEKLGDEPFNSFMDMMRVAPDLLRFKGHRSVSSMVGKYFSDDRLRTVFSFHPLADRRQSVPRERHLLHDYVSDGAFRRPFRDGRHWKPCGRSRRSRREGRAAKSAIRPGGQDDSRS